MRARMLNGFWLATALALAGGCVTVPATKPGIDMGSTNSATNPNGTKLSRFWKRQTDKVDALAKKPSTPPSASAPPNAEFYVTMAVAQEQSGNATKADEFYQKALATDPNSLETLSSYAHFEDRRGHLVAATKLYKKTLAKHPEEAGIFNDLALCYQRRGMLNESIATLHKATHLHPDRQLYHNNLASVLVDAERNDEAVAELLATNSPAVAHYNMGCLLHRRGNDTLAVDHFQQAIAVDPNLRAAEQWLAKLAPQARSDAAEPMVAQRQRALRPVQVELGQPSEWSDARADDNGVNGGGMNGGGANGGFAAGPAVGQPTAQPIAQPTGPLRTPAQAVSTQSVWRKPNGAPVDEIAPLPPPIQVLRPANVPARQQAEPSAMQQPDGLVLRPTAPAADEALASSQLAADPQGLFAPPPSTEPPATEPPATGPLATGPSSTEPLSGALTTAPTTPLDDKARASRAAAGRIEYPHYPVQAASPDGFEIVPAAPLPEVEVVDQPSRPTSQPDEIEPLPPLGT